MSSSKSNTAGPISIKRGPYLKLAGSLLAVFAFQTLWTRYVSSSTFMTPGEWATWWAQRIVAFVRWANVQWQQHSRKVSP